MFGTTSLSRILNATYLSALLPIILFATFSHASKNRQANVHEIRPLIKAAALRKNPLLTADQMRLVEEMSFAQMFYMRVSDDAVSQDSSFIKSESFANNIVDAIAKQHKQVESSDTCANSMCAAFGKNRELISIGTKDDFARSQKELEGRYSFLSIKVKDHRRLEKILTPVTPVVDTVNSLIETINTNALNPASGFTHNEKENLESLATMLSESLDRFSPSLGEAESGLLDIGDQLLSVTKILEESEFRGSTIAEFLDKYGKK